MKNKLMKYKEYRATVYYDADDRIFVGEVIGINDSLSFHATDVDELEQHFHDCIDNYLELCRELNKLPEKECTGSFSVRIEPEEQRSAIINAASMNISFNQYIGKAISAYNAQFEG